MQRRTNSQTTLNPMQTAVPMKLFKLCVFFLFVSSIQSLPLGAQDQSPAEETSEMAAPTSSDTSTASGASTESDGSTGSEPISESPVAESSSDNSSTITANDPNISIDQLSIMVKPLTKSELEIETNAWFDLLREKASEIASARLEALDENAAASVAAEVARLQDERTAISDRLEIVLYSLEQKGGDVAEYRSYIASVSGIELDTSNVRAAWMGFKGWLISKEGGQRWGWNFAKFLIILIISSFIAKFIARSVNWVLDRKVRLSQLAENLIANSIKNIVFLVGFAIALTALEIDITPIIAAIGATGLVVGLALQGTLSNFASGLMILINRPFDVGNVVTAGGITGKVDKMNLVSTRFLTFDNQTIHVPNNEIWNNVITNITANENRRVDLEFGISYDDDFEKAEQIMLEILNDHELVLDDPEPMVVTHALADSSVNIVCRPWAKTSDYWTVKTDVTRSVKRRFDEAGISIPYPHQDIYLHKVEN